MKIIGGRDYYDGLMNYGGYSGTDIIFIRQEFPIALKDFKAEVPPVIFIVKDGARRYYFDKYEYVSVSNGHNISLFTIFIFFAGLFYH